MTRHLRTHSAGEERTSKDGSNLGIRTGNISIVLKKVPWTGGEGRKKNPSGTRGKRGRGAKKVELKANRELKTPLCQSSLKTRGLH